MSANETVSKLVAALNAHDARGYAALYAPDATVHDPYYPEPLQGRAAIEEDIVDFFGALPDLRAVVHLTIADGLDTATRMSVSATHNGPLKMPGGEVPPTGRPLNFDLAVFDQINERGEVVEERRYFDVASHLVQLGLA